MGAHVKHGALILTEGTSEAKAMPALAARNGLTVVRIFGFPVQEGFNLQLAPGVYNETAFRGMDMVVAEAVKHGLRLVIALANNWAYNDLQTDWKCGKIPSAVHCCFALFACCCDPHHPEGHAYGQLTWKVFYLLIC